MDYYYEEDHDKEPPPVSRRKFEEAQAEVKYWKTVAVYLAQCAAGNASIIDLKKTSKYHKRRFLSIMRKARDWLRKARPAPSSYFHYENVVAGELHETITWIETRYPELKNEAE